jgi:hypothetical protein
LTGLIHPIPPKKIFVRFSGGFAISLEFGVNKVCFEIACSFEEAHCLDRLSFSPYTTPHTAPTALCTLRAPVHLQYIVHC